MPPSQIEDRDGKRNRTDPNKRCPFPTPRRPSWKQSEITWLRGGAHCMCDIQQDMAAALSYGEWSPVIAFDTINVGYSQMLHFANCSLLWKCLHKIWLNEFAGSVPAFYREIYQIVCPNQEERIDRDMFVKILVKSSLPKQSLSQVGCWNMECLLLFCNARRRKINES